MLPNKGNSSDDTTETSLDPTQLGLQLSERIEITTGRLGVFGFRARSDNYSRNESYKKAQPDQDLK